MRPREHSMNNLFLDLKSTDTFFTVKGNDKPILFLCLTQDSDLAALLGKTADEYDNEQDEERHE